MQCASIAGQCSQPKGPVQPEQSRHQRHVQHGYSVGSDSDQGIQLPELPAGFEQQAHGPDLPTEGSLHHVLAVSLPTGAQNSEHQRMSVDLVQDRALNLSGKSDGMLISEAGTPHTPSLPLPGAQASAAHPGGLSSLEPFDIQGLSVEDFSPSLDAEHVNPDAAVGSEDSEEDELDDESYAGMLQHLRSLALLNRSPQPKRPAVLDSFDLPAIASLIKSGKVKRIVCMVGAGISVSAGIPDFRSPGTGLYSNLQKYDLPRPEAVFEIDFFKRNPRPFFMLAKELWPGRYRPTAAHLFMRLLHDKGLLLRCFSQNIDSLERVAGLPRASVVAAHGNFDGAHCVACHEEYPPEFVGDAVMRQGEDANAGEPCRCTVCGGLVKPDIVFFGEALPERFFEAAEQDLPECDLLIVMGTSLVVQPFALLIDLVTDITPRLLINREKAGELDPIMALLGASRGFDFGESNYRDALFLGDCDDGVRQLASLLGWDAELRELCLQQDMQPPVGPILPMHH